MLGDEVIFRDNLWWIGRKDPDGDIIWGNGLTKELAEVAIVKALARAKNWAEDDPTEDWNRATL